MQLRSVMRENTFLPGNFNTSYKTTKQKVAEMVSRLSYDPYERRRHAANEPTGNQYRETAYDQREKTYIITLNTLGKDDGPVYTKQEIDAIVQRLSALKHVPQPEPVRQRKPMSRELNPREREIVERLARQPVVERVEPSIVSPARTVTNKQLEEILTRLTQKKADAPEQALGSEARKVSVVELESILARLMTFDSEKWPPESKPHIYKLHA